MTLPSQEKPYRWVADSRDHSARGEEMDTDSLATTSSKNYFKLCTSHCSQISNTRNGNATLALKCMANYNFRALQLNDILRFSVQCADT